MEEKTPLPPYTDEDVDLESVPSSTLMAACSHKRHTRLLRTFCAPCPGDVEAIKCRQPSPFRLSPELVTHPILQDVNLDYNSDLLPSRQLQSCAAQSAAPLIPDNEKAASGSVTSAEIVKEQTRYEMYGCSNSRFKIILWLTMLAWATTTLSAECVWCLLILGALHPLDSAGHKTITTILYFGALVPYFLLSMRIHAKMREVAFKKWAYLTITPAWRAEATASYKT